MAMQVGEIAIVFGMITATSATGEQRVLHDGDPVFLGDVLNTVDEAQANVIYQDGTMVAVEDTFDVVESDVALLQATIATGEDPTQTAEPTAAGPEVIDSDEGTEVVQVQHLAPEVTPTSGFDTTGISILFPEREFEQELLDENTGNNGGSVPPIQPPSNTPPIADPVSSQANLASDVIPSDFPVSDIAFFKRFDIGGGLDGDLSIPENGLIDPADLGGFDAETSESDLTFSIESLPNFGDLYHFDSGIYTLVTTGNMASLPLTVSSQLFWAATQSQTLATAQLGQVQSFSFLNGLDEIALSNEGLTLQGFDLAGSPIAITAVTNDGLGIDAPDDRIKQLEFDDNSSEKIVMNFETISTDATISATHLIGREESGEIGVVTAFLNGHQVGEWTFTAGANAIADFSPLNGNVDLTSVGPGNRNGSVTFTLEDIVFDQLVFTATETQAPGQLINDSSDYFVAQISYQELDGLTQTQFTYSATDSDNNASAPVDVVIGLEPSTSSTSSDHFVWTEADLPMSGVGHDVVQSFDVAEGDTLDLSDLLQASVVSEQIDGLAVGNAGDEHLQINIRDTSGNVVQQLELVDISVVNNIAAQTTLSQLIDNGSIIVE